MKKEIGVIFDMDGTMLDNAEYHKEAWIEFLKKHGIKKSVEEYHRKLFGRTSKEILSIVFDRELSEEEKSKFSEEKEKTYRKIYKEHIKPQAGLLELLKQLEAKKIKMAVATSATKSNLKFTLKELNISSYFCCTTNSSEIRNSKPHPEIFLKTASNMGIEPQNCLVFEDSPPGVEAAVDAGMKVIVVNPSEKEKIEKHTDHIFPDFENIDVEFIGKVLESR